MRAPVAATVEGRRSQAARSAAPARGTATWQRSTGVRAFPRAAGASRFAAAPAVPAEQAHGLAGIARPEQRRHLLDRRRPRQLHRVPPPVVEPAVLDQRQRRLQHRQPPREGLRSRFLRLLAQLLLVLEPQHVLPRIAPRPGLARRPLRAEHPSARVGVERRQRDPELRRGLLGGEKPVVHSRQGTTAHIDSRIKIDNLNEAVRRWGLEGRTEMAIEINQMNTEMNTEVREGLEGVVAATTRLSSVDGEAGVLLLAGFPAEEIAPRASFEEMAWLLWHGDLPTAGRAGDVPAPSGGPAGAAPGGARPAAGGGPAAGAGDGRPAHGRRRAQPRRGSGGRSQGGRPPADRHLPHDRGRLLAAAPGGGAAGPSRGSRARGEFPLPALGRGAVGGAGAGIGNLSQHGDRSRLQRLDLRRPGDRLHPLGPDLRDHRRRGGAERAPARRRSRAGPGHGLRDRRPGAGRGGAAGEARPR